MSGCCCRLQTQAVAIALLAAGLPAWQVTLPGSCSWLTMHVDRSALSQGTRVGKQSQTAGSIGTRRLRLSAGRSQSLTAADTRAQDTKVVSCALEYCPG
jgi:hypothetical protein